MRNSNSNECGPGLKPYRVKQGDNIAMIVQQFRVPLDAIKATNPNKDLQNLRAGQIICIPQQTQFASCENGEYYVIRSGDTLYQIAQNRGITVDMILKANPNINPNRLNVGQIICIPESGKAPGGNGVPEAPLGTFQYTVKPGDTLFRIAQRYNTTVSNIMVFNPISNPDNISPGQELTIPQSPPEAIIYTVKPGDTLFSIAQEYGTQVDTIMEFNYMTDTTIQIGDRLVVPVSLRE